MIYSVQIGILPFSTSKPDYRPLGLGVQRRTRTSTRYAKIRGSIPRVGKLQCFLLVFAKLSDVELWFRVADKGVSNDEACFCFGSR
jgi:hypothetical protein